MLALIVVDYKSIEKTIKYLETCLAMLKTKNKLRLVIVDNSCNDDAIKYLNKLNIVGNKIDYIRHKKVSSIYQYTYKNHELILINANSNLGYAKGNNLGVVIINKLYNNIEYYIFSNNDLKFTEKLEVNRILDIFKKDEKIAVVGPRIRDLNGKDQSPNKKSNIWKRGVLYYPNMLIGNKLSRFTKNVDYTGESKYCYWVSGSFFIADSKKFIEVGMFDNNTFLYCEEMILSERLLKHNYLTYFYNDFSLIHEHGKTIKNTYATLLMEEINFNSNYYYYKEYTQNSKLNLYLFKVSFNLYKILYPIKRKIKTMIKG